MKTNNKLFFIYLAGLLLTICFMVVNAFVTGISYDGNPLNYHKRAVYIHPNRYTGSIIIYTNDYNVPVILTSSKPLKEVAISEVTNVPPIGIVWQTNSATNIIMTIRLIPNPETNHPANGLK